MNNIKYAIRFPDLQDIKYNKSTNIFSEKSITETTNTFLKTFDVLGSLTEFIIQKNRTNELSKQLNAKKRVLDANIENFKEQQRLEFEEYTKRLQEKLKFEKEKLELETKKLILETNSTISDFSISFKENMKQHEILYNLICNEKKFLNSIKDYINDLSNDYSQRKEYVLYCEMQRKSLELVDQYMKELI